jgi:hypothetical protein
MSGFFTIVKKCLSSSPLRCWSNCTQPFQNSINQLVMFLSKKFKRLSLPIKSFFPKSLSHTSISIVLVKSVLRSTFENLNSFIFQNILIIDAAYVIKKCFIYFHIFRIKRFPFNRSLEFVLIFFWRWYKSTWNENDWVSFDSITMNLKKISSCTHTSTNGSDDLPLSIGNNWMQRFILTYKHLFNLQYFKAKLIFPLKLVSVSSPSFNLKNEKC